MITQQQIDSLPWFHDFDFPGGLRARTSEQQNAIFQRLRWRFVEDVIRSIGVKGKSVIDVGCWDGYFSFLAEEMGAGRVVAADDFSQNWGSRQCFLIAKQLKQSQVTLLPDISVYTLSHTIQETFDIVLFLGVYYHLHSPYNAFAEIRKVSHDQSIVLVEGEYAPNRDEAFAHICLTDPSQPKFIPTTKLLVDMLESCYLRVEEIVSLADLSVTQVLRFVSNAEVLERVKQRLRSRRAIEAAVDGAGAGLRNRAIFVCRPFRGENRYHHYPPPFGLEQFDTRAGFVSPIGR